MAAMYAPHTLEPTRWIPGDGFQLHDGGPPYRILKRQKFDFLSAREVLIFEGCRALYRPPPSATASNPTGADEWVWDGALKIWVQINFAPQGSLLRRGTDWLCGLETPTPGAPAFTVANPHSRRNASLNILPEVLDRAIFPDFEIVVLDMRGGQSLSELQAAGWPDPSVPAPFSAAGATAIVRRLLELNVLLSQSGLCLANLHPDQLMIDANLNIRIRGIPLVAGLLPDGSFVPDSQTELAARAERDLIYAAEDVQAQRAPGGWLMHRWVAALIRYLATGRYGNTRLTATQGSAEFFSPQSPRRVENWEIGLFHALFTEARNGAAPALTLLSKLAGRRRDLIAGFSREYMAAAAGLLEQALQGHAWPEVIRLATETSARLPEIFHATEAVAAAALTASASAQTAPAPASANAVAALQGTAEFQQLNRLLDQIAHLETACDRATGLAAQAAASRSAAGSSSPAAGVRGPGLPPQAPLRPVVPSRLTGIVPLPPPSSSISGLPPPVDAATAETLLLDSQMIVDALGVPRERRPAAVPARTPTTGSSPLRALARDLAALPAFPAFRERLGQWLTAEQARLTPAWLEPPLSAPERETLDRHNPGLLARLPLLVEDLTRTALADLAASAAACATGGPRELPRFERAVQAVLVFADVFQTTVPTASAGESADPTAADVAAGTTTAKPAVDPIAALDTAIRAVETARVIEPTILARMLSGLASQHPAGRRAPRLAALQELHDALTRGAQAMREKRWLDALRDLRPALDAWPQYPVLQTQWKEALEQGLGTELVELQQAAAPGADPTAADPVVVAGLVALLQGPQESNRRWLGAWLSQIRVALEKYFAALLTPAIRAIPLERRVALQAALNDAFRQFDPIGAAQFHDHIALTEQRRRDLVAALANSRAQVALGKLTALWSSHESAQPAGAEDLGRAVLHVWLEQTTNAIEQMTAPADAATVAGLLERMLSPLHKLLALQSEPAPDGGAAPPASQLPARDLQEAILAIETDLYQRMLAVTTRPDDLEHWLNGWQTQLFTPAADRWQAVLQPAGRTALQDFLRAQQALREHRLDDAYVALAGTSAAADETTPADLNRFATVVAPAEIAQMVERLLEPWQRLKATAAKARAKVDLDDAARQLAQDLRAARKLRQQNYPTMAGTLAEIEQQIQVRETARTAVTRRQTEAEDFLAQARIAAAVREYQALKNDWAATHFPREQLDETLEAGREKIRNIMDAQVVEAERESQNRPAAGLGALQNIAAALEADPQREFFESRFALRVEAALAQTFQHWLAGQNHRRYGVALMAGLTSGALPPDAAFWAATLQQDRRAGLRLAPTAAAASATAADAVPSPSNLSPLALLPCGAVGPDEWQAWLAATRDLYQGPERKTLDDLDQRLAQKSAELHTDDAALSTALAATLPLAEQAECLKKFTVKWRNGAKADQRRAEFDRLRQQAQAAYDDALRPPAAPWLTRPFQHWQQLRAVSDEAAVVCETTEHAAALKTALHGWLWRVGVAAALVLSAVVAALVVWL